MTVLLSKSILGDLNSIKTSYVSCILDLGLYLYDYEKDKHEVVTQLISDFLLAKKFQIISPYVLHKFILHRENRYAPIMLLHQIQNGYRL